LAPIITIFYLAAFCFSTQNVLRVTCYAFSLFLFIGIKVVFYLKKIPKSIELCIEQFI